MTILTLEQVRQTRFHLARRNGYEPADVDNFVDQVEATLATLGEQNEALRKQIESRGADVQADAPVAAEQADAEQAPSGDGEEVAQLRGQLEGAHGEISSLRGELDGRSQELEHLRAELETARSALSESDQGDVVASLQGELEALRGELSARDQRIAELEAELDGARNELTNAQAVAAERTGKVENIVVTAAPDAAPAVTKLLQMATEQAERLVSEAEADAARISSEASAKANADVEKAASESHQALSGARARAEQIEAEARSRAEALTSEAQAKAEALTGDAQAKAEALQAEGQARSQALQDEIHNRRSELLAGLEADRDELRGKVEHLRSFEERYRLSLTSQVQAHLDSLAKQAQPEDSPELLGEQQSATPRLDALLNDKN